MSISESTVVDTNVKGGIVELEITVTNETIFTLDVLYKTGKHDNSRMTLEFSPDNGLNWFPGDKSTNGFGSVTMERATTKVRPCVLEVERSAASATVFITAK